MLIGMIYQVLIQSFLKLLTNAMRYPKAMNAPGAKDKDQHTVFFREE